ncbi:MAG: hypothetical protein CSA72_11390 [Rhodobacterales bacterium]|nr:MAG: hypothetical protein CSA72_11390 [Rhodobacterales bacterium]
MISRRSFLTAAAASAGTALAAPALASTYIIPDDHKPARVRLQSYVGAGEIVVAPSSFCLYWGLGGGEAIRYRVGIGSPELYRAGTFTVGRKVEWPRWTPTANMIRREPDKYRQYAGGMPGGPLNPLGSRALYLYDGSRDTMMRIHGTPEPWTITRATSSGCVRMINAYMLDLFARTPMGTTVRLLPKMPPKACYEIGCLEEMMGQ